MTCHVFFDRKFTTFAYEGKMLVAEGLHPFCLRNTVPPSANAASLGVYGNINTNLYAGQVDISIPLWTVKSREISFPISLNYSGTGIKVDEFGGWVGLGWTIQGIGAITRTLRGLADEGSSGYFVEGKYVPDDPSQLQQFDTTAFDMFMKAATGKTDLEPDLFSYNFGGHSGDFFFQVDRIRPTNYMLGQQ